MSESSSAGEGESSSARVPRKLRVVVVDAEGKAMPVPRHALLISDNPTSAPPRRVVTTLDGTADVRLRPGNYTVESDEPLAFQGKAYQWRHTLDVAAGRLCWMKGLVARSCCRLARLF